MQHQFRRDERRYMSYPSPARGRRKRQRLRIIRIEGKGRDQRILRHRSRLLFRLPLGDRLGDIGEGDSEAAFRLRGQLVGIGKTHWMDYLFRPTYRTFLSDCKLSRCLISSVNLQSETKRLRRVHRLASRRGWKIEISEGKRHTKLRLPG